MHPVVGGVCRETREAFLTVAEHRNINELNRIIFQNVRGGSMIITDCWRGYNGVGMMGLNYTHLTVNHGQNFVDPNNPNTHTNTVERFWRSVREEVPKQTRKVEVEAYLEQFVFFHNKGLHTDKTKFEILTDVFSNPTLFN